MRNLIVASALAFTIYLGFGLILPLFPSYVLLLGGGGTEVGILLASFMLTRAFLARPFGKLSDRIGRKKVIIAGMFTYSVLAFLFTIPDSWFGLVFVRLLQGVASAMVWPVGEALVVDSAPREKRSRAISIYMIISNIGFIAGPFIGSGIQFIARYGLHTSELASVRMPFYFTSVISLAGAIIGLIMLRDALPVLKDLNRRRMEAAKALKKLKPRIKRSLYFLYSNSFFEGFSWSVGSVVMFLFMDRAFSMPNEVFSILFGLSQAVGLIFVFPSGVLSDRTRKKPFVVYGSLVSKLSTIIMSLTPLLPLGYWLSWVFFAGKDTGRQIATPATRSLQADLSPVRIRGRLIATIQAYSNVGSLIGSLAGGLVWDHTHDRYYNILLMDLPGYTVPFLISAFMGTVAALLVLRFVHEPARGRAVG
ncbi:MAG: MFS transporter [Candidatus Thermoplasmatota archaeon]|nr:MFS transporter [Candidatus Thermoplasmatota archaeon]